MDDNRQRPQRLRRVVVAVATATLTGLGAIAVPAAQATGSPANPAVARSIDWGPCPPLATPTDPDAQCGSFRLPVDWDHPAGPTFELALARHPATDPDARIGSLIFGPGGPGDSGVSRIRTGIGRFSTELRRRFDIVSFDPRGIAGSNPVKCSSALLATQPSPIITSPTEFEATVVFNRRLAQDCRARTGPVYEHLDTLSTVRDLDALRAALGETKLTFHGSSYGTLLGAQYAETFPNRIRALVLEGVMDHSLGTRAFLQTQAQTEQDAFEQFVLWCERTDECALHDQDVRAVWADLLDRAERGELPDLDNPGTRFTPYTLTVLAQKKFYNPDWAELADKLKDLADTSSRRPITPTSSAVSPMEPGSTPSPAPTDEPTSSYPFALFCQDWRLPVRNYREYAEQMRRIEAIAPDMKYPRALIAVAVCLGEPDPVHNPQHRLKVRTKRTILLTNAWHDPATGYNWAVNVARQLGSRAVLLTYEGSSHGTYNSTPCARAAIDRYLISLVPPAPGTHCPAVDPPVN